MSWQRPVGRDLGGRMPGAGNGPYPTPLPAPDPGRPRRWETGCGTEPGWHTHRSHGETPCKPCETAHKKALNAWAAARAARATTPED